MNFTNKTIWITGASSGIGEALAYAFCKEGANLILSARRMERLELVKQKCEQIRPDVTVLPLALDLCETDTMPDKVTTALQHFSTIDVLVNNGGIGFRGMAKDTLLEVDKKVMEVNYFGSIAITKALLPHFLERKSGQIVVVSSLTGKFGTPLRTAYAASKHALHGFFDSLRAELHNDNIQVCMICPGFVRTEILDSSLQGDGSRLSGNTKEEYDRMPAKVFAQKALKAISQQKDEVFIGGKEKMGIYIKRFFPALFNRLIRRAKVK